MKLFRKIRQTLIKEGNIKKYLLYAIGEILLVMIGISLAFQLDNWNENIIKKNTEIRYYENIRDQIDDDKRLILEQMDYNYRYMAQYKYANEIIESNNRKLLDTLGPIIRNLTQYSDFDRQGNIYETMVNSGEIKIMRNFSIVNKIRALEEKYIYINRMENIHYDAMLTYVIPAITPTIKFSTTQIKRPELIFNYEFQNLVLALLQVMTEKDEVYKEALEQIKVITALIAEELESN